MRLGGLDPAFSTLFNSIAFDQKLILSMFPTFTDQCVTVNFVVGRRAILASHDAFESFRSQSPQAHDPLTSMHYFLDWAWVRDGVPATAFVSRSGHLFGIVLFSLRRKFGVSLGFASAGRAAGDVSVIATLEDQQAVAEAACRAMINVPTVHTVLCSVQWTEAVEPGTIWPISGIRGHWHFRETRDRLSLNGGADAVMDRLGYKMRRNIRSYRRRAEAGLGCRFLPDLTGPQRRDAVTALHDRDIYSLPTKVALRQEAVLSRLPGAFAVGTQDQHGTWLSYIAGWRKDGDTHVIWQLNEASLRKSSMSTIMRSYLLDHEIERGSSALVFVSGTTAFWGRACEPTMCGDLLALRPGAVGTVARRLSSLVSPNGQLSRLHGQITESA